MERARSIEPKAKAKSTFTFSFAVHAMKSTAIYFSLKNFFLYAITPNEWSMLQYQVMTLIYACVVIEMLKKTQIITKHVYDICILAVM